MVCAILALGTAAQAQKPAPDGPASAELREIVKADQAPRQSSLPTAPNAIEEMIAADRQRRQRVAALLRDGKLQTGEDFDNAALVFQHGETPDDFLTAHELAVIAALKGKRSTLPTLAEDRFLEHIGRLQRFGTQFKLGQNGKMELSQVAEGHPTDVTDALRADLFVPTPAEWRRYPGPEAYVAAKPRIEKRQTRGTDAQYIAEAAKRPEATELKHLASPELAANQATPARQRVLELYQADKLETPGDYANAAKVLRHGGEGDALLLAHELALVAAFRGDRQAPRLAAEALDAYLVAAGQPQRYGTVASAPVAPSVTDAVRAEFSVPPLKKATDGHAGNEKGT
jgi:hypothetical protein